jgi:DNA-binding MltR family transcriptional regulator
MDKRTKQLINIFGNSLDDLMGGLTEDQVDFLRETGNFRHTLNLETDRGCALMASAYLEDRLEFLIKSFLIEEASNSLFEFNGPFGTLSSKITTAYALGLVPKNLSTDLNTIRKVRNEFAHRADLTDFESSGIKERVSSFSFVDVKDLPRSRSKFTRTVMAMLAIIETTSFKMERRKQPDNADTSSFMKGIEDMKD